MTAVEADLSEIPFVDLGAEYQALRAEIEPLMAGVMARGEFILGPQVERFEASFAQYCGVAHAIGVDSGFSALELGLRALGIGPGDEVVTVANTFIATVGAIESTGARPVLVDADPVTHLIDTDAVEAAITPRTRAILPVHLYGHLADTTALRAIAERHGLAIVEDACQAHGALDGDRRAGSLGTLAAFSFYPSKNLGAYGDGGIVVTDDSALAERLRMLRNLGSRVKYQHEIKGYNHRLDGLQGAVLNVKLPHLDARNAARREAAAQYLELLAPLPVSTPQPRPGTTSVYHLFVIETDDRDGLAEQLSAARIAHGIHYPVPIHLQPAYAELGHGPGSFPVAERLAERILSLPMFPELTTDQVRRVVDVVRTHLTGAT